MILNAVLVIISLGMLYGLFQLIKFLFSLIREE